MSAATLDPGVSAAGDGSGVAVKLAYSLGNLGKSIVATSFDIFLLYYLVRIAAVTPFAAGGLLMAVMLWDGGADVAVAYLADRHGRANALGRLVLLGAPLCGVSFWLIFAIPPTIWWHRAIFAAVVSCRVGYTLCDIGHNTLLVRLATTARNAATVSGMRLIFSAMGVGLVGLAATIILSPGPWHRQTSFATVAMIGGAIYAGTLLIAIHETRHLHLAEPGMALSSGRASFGTMWRNRQYRIVLFLIALQAGVMPLFNRALPFFGEAMHGSAGWAGTALTAITLSQALSLPAWMALARWRSPNEILILAYGAMLLAMVAAQAGGAIGFVGLSLIGIAQAGMNMAIWALLALSVRRGVAAGARQEALPVGLFLAVLKGSAGIGGGLLAMAVGAGNAWCSTCISHWAGPLIFTATIVPMCGCIIGLLVAVSTRCSLARAGTHSGPEGDRPGKDGGG